MKKRPSEVASAEVTKALVPATPKSIAHFDENKKKIHNDSIHVSGKGVFPGSHRNAPESSGGASNDTPRKTSSSAIEDNYLRVLKTKARITQQRIKTQADITQQHITTIAVLLIYAVFFIYPLVVPRSILETIILWFIGIFGIERVFVQVVKKNLHMDDPKVR